MLTKAEITAASNTFDGTDIVMIVTLVRNSVRFKNSPALFSDLETRLNAANGTLKAQQIHAMMDKIEELGIGEVIVRGEHNEIDYRQTLEREAMINYIIAVLYKISDGSLILTDEEIIISTRGYGVGQREVKGDFI